IADRLRLVRATIPLFTRLFAVRCAPVLAHLDEPGGTPLNGRCYMWWDTFPSLGRAGDPHLKEMQREALEALRAILSLNSLPCQESALHGLGHWHRHQAEQVEEIIDDFLATHTTARPEILRYARAARTGCIL